MSLGRFAARRWRIARRGIARLFADRPKHIDMRALRPPLPVPEGRTGQAILDALLTVAIDDGPPGELAQYARADCERFLRTLGLVPEGVEGQDGAVLEIGANPWFLSLLLRWFRPDLRLDHTNFFAAGEGRAAQRVTVRAPSGAMEEHRFDFANLNIEAARFPFDDASFDGVLFCEVIEHLQMDPLHALREIRRVLRPGGWLILTTPNVARLVNAVRLANGENLYDPYSAHGPYGRHNREYTVNELRALLTFAGFGEEVLFTSDVHGEDVPELTIAPELASLLKHREADLGEYLFSRWRKVEGEAPGGRPGWLYMSYPADEIAR